MTNTAKSFTTWLKLYRKQASNIGDLARDVKVDSTWPKHAKTKQYYRNYLLRCNASHRYLQAFDLAWDMWEQYQHD